LPHIRCRTEDVFSRLPIYSYFTSTFYLYHWTTPAPAGPKDYYKLKELPAYEWQRENASAMGLDETQKAKINNRIEQINNGEAPGGD